jgi:hypothetical protein
MKPGDKVYYVRRDAARYPYLQSIKAGILIELVGTDTTRPTARVHLGWLGPEEVDAGSVFEGEEAAKAHLAVLVKKHIRKLRADIKRLSALDLGKVKTQDRTRDIKKSLDRLLGGS